MLLKINHTAVKVRVKHSHLAGNERERYTGAVTYAVSGRMDGQRVRLALGTEEEKTAIRRVEKIKTACAVGLESSLWQELEEALPRKTFDFFAAAVGYQRSAEPSKPSLKPTWIALIESFQLEMERMILNKTRGASRKEGILAPKTRERYEMIYDQFGAFLKERGITSLDAITPALMEMYKVARVKEIVAKKQSRGGGSVALHIAVLHRLFNYAVEKGMTAAKPINLKHESKPGDNPRNGARQFTADELAAMRAVAGQDLFSFLVLRWTGLRISDAIALTWGHVHFDRGRNGEIEVLTQKRSKVAIVPLAPELHDALKAEAKRRKPQTHEHVLLNPDTGKPFTSEARLRHRIQSLGARAKVKRATPHCFRDTFVCDMLARGCSTYVVAQMVADTTDTIEKHYAAFVPAARDAAQQQMETGLGIEERARIAAQRGRKVVGIRGATSPVPRPKS